MIEDNNLLVVAIGTNLIVYQAENLKQLLDIKLHKTAEPSNVFIIYYLLIWKIIVTKDYIKWIFLFKCRLFVVSNTQICFYDVRFLLQKNINPLD